VLRIGICDDEAGELERLGALVGDYFRRRGIEASIGAFRSGEELLAKRDQGFDLVFLDVFMEASDGISVAREIRRLDKTCVIVFATNSREHAIRGYGVRALQYLLKPIDASQLDATLDLAVEELSSGAAKSIQVQNREGRHRVALDDLAFAESRARVVTLHTRAQGEIAYYDRLDNLEALCADERFLRCHKSFLVNLDYVYAIVNTRLLMRSGEELPVSMSVAAAKEAFASRTAGAMSRRRDRRAPGT
jgi:DNA-binding LytR/AlgR family response regulator